MRYFLNKSVDLCHWLPERIRQHALERGNKIALRNEFDQTISYMDLFRCSLALSETIKCSSAESVALFTKDPIKLAIGILATWYSHKTAVPLRK